MSVNFATYADLTQLTNQMTLNERTSVKSTAASLTGARKDTFLAHSSKDAEYLPGVIKLLENHGALVYCDLDDERMPENPNPETAAIVKGQIKQSDRLVVFITTNSKDSKWVPWELGIGDAELAPDNVALLPAATYDYEQSWAKQEYLGLYRHIVRGDMEGEAQPLWMVYDYRTNTATKLSKWCRSRSGHS